MIISFSILGGKLWGVGEFAGLTVTDWLNWHSSCFNLCIASFIEQESTLILLLGQTEDVSCLKQSKALLSNAWLIF